MTTRTKIYENEDYQMEHCDPCEMPAAMAEANDPSYSLLKHIIIESRACANDPHELEYMQSTLEAQGYGEMFEAAQKCIRCAEGMCLLIDGSKTGWQVGGSLVVE